MTAKKILVIDDDQELVELLTEYLAHEQIEVTACHDGLSGLEQAHDDSIDLILLDVMMPKMDGFEVLKSLGGNHKTPILMLTAKGDDNDRILGLELGADDYLAKPFKHRELLARINAIFRRIDIVKQQDVVNTVTAINNVELNHATREVFCHQNKVNLTGTEYQILYFLMKNTGNVISKSDISEQILERPLSQYDRSIDMHVSNIRRKLIEFSADDKFKTIRGAGYIFLPGK
ncbi:MAG: response regulator [Thalassotalea sp.]